MIFQRMVRSSSCPRAVLLFFLLGRCVLHGRDVNPLDILGEEIRSLAPTVELVGILKELTEFRVSF